MVCADYSGKCQSNAEVVCSVCGQSFCWDHILTLRLAPQEATVQQRAVCRRCTEQLVDEIEEERARLKHENQVLKRGIAALEKQAEGEAEGYLDV